MNVCSLSMKTDSISNVTMVTGGSSPLVIPGQDRQAAMSRARQASLSLRSRPKLSSAEPRNKSFSSASQSDGQNQHMARSEQRARAGDRSRTKSAMRGVTWRHGRGAWSFGDMTGAAAAMAAAGSRSVVILARLSGSSCIWIARGPAVAPSFEVRTSATCSRWNGLTGAGQSQPH